MTSRSTDVLLGTLFFGALLALGVATIALSDVRFGAPVYPVEIFTRDAGYLRPGDPVLVDGMPGGKVVDLRRLPEPRPLELPGGRVVECTVAITARLDVDIVGRLPVDSRLLIEDRGLLGGKLIRVAAGVQTRLLEAGQPLVAEAVAPVFQAVGEVISENRERLQYLISDLSLMSDRARRGEGLLGALINDGQLADDARTFLRNGRETSEHARSIAKSIDEGAGTLGRLVKSDEMWDDGRAALAAWEETGASLARSARGVEELVAGVERGEGNLGKLLKDSALHDRFAALVDDVSALSSDARHGRGLLHALIYDEVLVDDLRRAVALTLGAIEDARESSPVQGFGSFLFGTF